MQLEDGTLARLRRPHRRRSTGELRVVDYKTGRAPAEGPAESSALFQMKFLRRGDVARTRRRVLAGCGCCSSATAGPRLHPDVDELARFEKTSRRCGRESRLPAANGEFPPNPGRMCTLQPQIAVPSLWRHPSPYPETRPPANQPGG